MSINPVFLRETKLSPVSQILFDAANYIKKYGHNTNGFAYGLSSNEQPPACIVGALHKVSKNKEQVDAAKETIMASRAGICFIRWNDTHSAEEVISLLEELALT